MLEEQCLTIENLDCLCMVISVLLGPKSLREGCSEEVQDVGLDRAAHCRKRSPFHMFFNSTPKGSPPCTLNSVFNLVCRVGRHIPASLHPKAKPKSCTHLTVPLALPQMEKSQEHWWFAPGTGRKAPLLSGQLVPGLVSTRTEKLASQFISHFYSLDTIIDPH